jgi:DNA modification methylase
MRKASSVALFPEGQSQAPRPRSLDKNSRANDLNGKDWTRYSISVWNDIRKTAEEAKLGHPAMFPGSLVERLLLCFSRDSQEVVLDPFCGSGATLVAAKKMGKLGIGFEVASEYHSLAIQRLRQTQSRLFSSNDAPEGVVHLVDARHLGKYVAPSSVDICITSPPYWDILSRKRSADSKPIRDYAQGDGDLSKIDSYELFLDEMAVVFGKVRSVLKAGCYCMVVVMDIRKQDKFYPFHADLASRLSREDVGFMFDDTIIWDRRHEYNNLRPLGYPTTFRINKIHEYILIFRKPK